MTKLPCASFLLLTWQWLLAFSFCMKTLIHNIWHGPHHPQTFGGTWHRNLVLGPVFFQNSGGTSLFGGPSLSSWVQGADPPVSFKVKIKTNNKKAFLSLNLMHLFTLKKFEDSGKSPSPLIDFCNVFSLSLSYSLTSGKFWRHITMHTPLNFG